MGELNRAAILSDNINESATLSATTEASADTPASNAQTFQLSEIWRSTANTGQTLQGTTGESEVIHSLHINTHNFSGDATIRVRISDQSNLSSPVYDVTFNAWPSLTGLEEEALDLGGLDGAPIVSELSAQEFYTSLHLNLVLEGTLESAAGATVVIPEILTRQPGETQKASSQDNFYNSGSLRIVAGTGIGQTETVASYVAGTRTITTVNAFGVTPDNTSEFELDMSGATTVTTNDGTYQGLHWGITIEDSLNDDAFVEIGWWGAGQIIQPFFDINIDNNISVVDPAQKFLTEAQSVWVNQQNKFRTASFAFGFLSENEAKADMLRVARKNGASKPLVYFPFIENSNRSYVGTILGLLESGLTLRQVRKDYTKESYAVDFNLREII